MRKLREAAMAMVIGAVIAGTAYAGWSADDIQSERKPHRVFSPGGFGVFDPGGWGYKPNSVFDPGGWGYKPNSVFDPGAWGYRPKLTPGVTQRQRWQRGRIRAGVRSGELTRKETGSLIRGQKKVCKSKKAARSDGKVTLRERKRLHKAQNRQSRRIYRAKHNPCTPKRRR